MPTKGELLLSYDEEDIVKQEIEFIKENWTDFAEKHGQQTDEKVEKIVWNRLSDGWLYQNHWGDFKDALTSLMKGRNPSLEWESPDYHSYEDDYHQEDQKFNMTNGEELLRKFINFDSHNNISFIKIFSYGNDGLCIDPEWQQEKCLIAACRQGFYRDWEHGGICVARTEAEEWP